MSGFLRRLTIALNARGQNIAADREARSMAAMVARAGGNLGKTLAGMSEAAAAMRAEVGTWSEPEELRTAEQRTFDALDVRCWIEIASAAGVPVIPYRTILSLDEGEADLLSGQVQAAIPAATERRAGMALDALDAEGKMALAAMLDVAPPGDPASLGERLYAAMDDVPEGWMVRHSRCGSSALKALAGVGASDGDCPSVRFEGDLEVGAGWVRQGNRRRIDVSDRRVIQGAVEGTGHRSDFVARPWSRPGRLLIADDPHRAGTPYQGKGAWPAEWRVFIEDGRVVGVSSYYAWAGQAEPLDAQMALQAAAMGQAVADEASRRGLVPGWTLLSQMRRNSGGWAREVEEHLPAGGVHCTLDFIETDDGLRLLEGGPPWTPKGGGFPCAFAGSGWPRGVALRPMPHVELARPETWVPGVVEGCIYGWDEASAIAGVFPTLSP